MNRKHDAWRKSYLGILPLLGCASLLAQTVDNEDYLDDEDIYELSPFEISTEDEIGYTATTTLAGTRVRTELKDLAASVSVVTDQFMSDTGVVGSEDLLVYTTNTEVGGIFGNYAGLGNSQNLSERDNLVKPSSNTRVRGLSAADNTRDFFITDIPWDGYNVDRADLQRGPNSILFGVGSPSGMINTSTIVPYMTEDAGKFEARYGEYNSTRFVADINKVIIEDVLAVRIAALREDQNYQQKPAYERDDRVYAVVDFRPQLLDESWAGTTNIRAKIENGNIQSNRPRQLPPMDLISSFFLPEGGNTYGIGRNIWDTYIMQTSASPTRGAQNPAVGIQPFIASGGLGGIDGTVMAFYDVGQSNYFYISQQEVREGDDWGIGPDGNIDGTVDGVPYGRMLNSAGWNTFTRNIDTIAGQQGFESPFPLAQRNYYKDKTLSDPTTFDFYNQLLDGNNKSEWNDFNAVNFSLGQTFLDNRFGLEYVFDYQEYEDGSTGILNGNPGITVDINRNYLNVAPSYDRLAEAPTEWDPATVSGGNLNPKAGSAAVTGVTNQANFSRYTEREDHRLTIFGQFYGRDFFEEGSFLERFIGRHVVTGLISSDTVNTSTNRWTKFNNTTEWALQSSFGATDDALGITRYKRQIEPVIYLSGDLRGNGSASGLYLPNIKGTISPVGSTTAERFNSTWNSTVDPAAPWSTPTGSAPDDSTQSENPANYVGWEQQPITILNADKGDRDQMYYEALRNYSRIDSQGLTWQGYLFDGLVVPTYGWRKDKVKSYGASAPQTALTRLVDPKFTMTAEDAAGAFVSEGETTTWGVVMHAPEKFTSKLPFNTTVSAFYNDSQNFQPVNRVGYNTEQLPNPGGKSKDYGLVINTLDGKLTFKITRYETEITDASLEGGALASESYFLHDATPLGAATVAYNMAGLDGLLQPEQNTDWFWNYTLQSTQPDYNWDRDAMPQWLKQPWTDPDTYFSQPIAAGQREAMLDFANTMPSQEYLDAIGIPINAQLFTQTVNDWYNGVVTGQAAADLMSQALSGRWTPGAYITGVQSTTGGRINGMNPVATIGTISKGYEFEVSARPIRGWDITINASKTEAVRTELGKEFADVVESQYERWQGPAGDLRLWWGGASANSFRTHYNNHIWSAYNFTSELSGQQAAEIRPWRANIVSNYAFQEGKLAGLNVGVSYRWQDKSILGYGLNDEQTGLDVDKKFYGPTEDAIDLWAGYGRQLTDKIHWRVQVNVRNVGDDAHLVPISVDVDGSVAAQRIVNGMTWFVTNTFEF